MKAWYVSIFLPLALTGCAGGLVRQTVGNIKNADSYEEAREILEGVVREDLIEALRSTEEHDDVVAAQCWRGLLVMVDRVDENFFTVPKGVFSTYQKVRNTRRILGDVNDEMKLACGALKADSKLRLLNLVGL